MSRVGEPMDLTREINDIKGRLENLEARILTLREDKPMIDNKDFWKLAKGKK